MKKRLLCFAAMVVIVAAVFLYTFNQPVEFTAAILI